MSSSSETLTVAFFGASTGVGLSTLKHTLTANHQCIALCRYPSKLTTIFPNNPSNLKIIEGNATDVVSVSKCLQTSDGKLVDIVISTIGGKPTGITMANDQPEVCQKGASTLIDSINSLRSSGVSGNPYIISMSSTGLSTFGRDIPIAMIPLYKVVLKRAHVDKILMENAFIKSGESYTIVRASMLMNGESKKNIRVGVEDVKTGRESEAIGYTISREDAGKWIAENLVLKRDGKYKNKIASITY